MSPYKPRSHSHLVHMHTHHHRRSVRALVKFPYNEHSLLFQFLFLALCGFASSVVTRFGVWSHEVNLKDFGDGSGGDCL